MTASTLWTSLSVWSETGRPGNALFHLPGPLRFTKNLLSRGIYNPWIGFVVYVSYAGTHIHHTWNSVGVRIYPGRKCRLVTEWPVPENWTLTVVAEAAKAGLTFGIWRVGLVVPFVPLECTSVEWWSSTDVVASVRPTSEKSLDIGAIHPAATYWAKFSRPCASVSAFPGFNANSLTRLAVEGSRMISLRVIRIWPISANASLTNLKSRRTSLGVQCNITSSFSNNDRNWWRRSVASESIWLTVLRDRCPTSAPLRFCRFKRFFNVRPSALHIRLSKARILSRIVEMWDVSEPEKADVSDRGSWGDVDGNWDGRGDGEEDGKGDGNGKGDDGDDNLDGVLFWVPRDRAKRSKGLWAFRLPVSKGSASISGYSSMS